MSDKNERLVQIFNSEKDIWEFVAPISVKEGDIFRMYEPDMTPVIDTDDGKHEHIASSNAYYNKEGIVTQEYKLDE